MIKIDIKNHKEWNSIKEKHKDYLKKEIKRRLSNVTYNISSKIYEKFYRNNLVYSFNEIDKAVIEELFNGQYNIKNKYTYNFTFKDENILDFIAYGELEDIINKFSTYSGFDKLFKWIFCFDNFSKKADGWGRHEFIKSMGTVVCPYCNRNYITGYYENKHFRTTANIDHFYPQSKYPYLALSLLNFIPSCSICNSSIKLNNDFSDCIYPYKESFDDLNAVFSIKGSDGFGYLLDNSLDFDIVIKEKEDGKLPNNVSQTINKFKILQIYQSHKDIVQELLWKIQVYTDKNIEEIYSDYKPVLNKENIELTSNDRIKEIIFGVFLDKDQYEKRPLAKLLSDIYTEFNS